MAGATEARARRLTTADVVRQSLQGRRTDVPGLVFEGLLLLALLISLGVLVTLLVDIWGRGSGVLFERGTDFLTGSLSSNPARAGIGQGIFGSILVMLFVVILAFPIGISAAIYLEEYARDTRLTRLLNTTVRNLAGVPSIVYGLLGLAVFVVALRPITGGRSVLSGGLTLAILVLPIVIITSAEALRAVPASIREAGYGVGATKWEVTRSHVLPYAAPGVLTGTILSLSRAFGETAPLILVGAVTGGFSVATTDVVERLQGPYTALPTIVFTWARLPNQEFRALTAAAIIVLLGLILIINATAILLRNRYDRRW
ncbi:MAG: phosphate ABC transporter permease PstA [Chloroflexi bacterium]|nr:phosphate ABC transporter permease PstA [Chloroflexota bacterium]